MPGVLLFFTDLRIEDLYVLLANKNILKCFILKQMFLKLYTVKFYAIFRDIISGCLPPANTLLLIANICVCSKLDSLEKIRNSFKIHMPEEENRCFCNLNTKA